MPDRSRNAPLLHQKLGLRPGVRGRAVRASPDILDRLRLGSTELVEGLAGRGAFDFVIAFTSSRAQLVQLFSQVERRLSPAGMFWVAWPKRGSGVATDLDDEVVRRVGLDSGLVDVKVCAISPIWSGLKFVRRLEDRDPRTRSS
jgi:hypothetical protein